MTTTPPVAPWGILFNKKEARFAGGTITRGARIAAAHRSRHATDRTDTVFGMGFLDAILAVLHGLVGSIQTLPTAHQGRLVLRSSGGSSLYHLTWKVIPASQALLLGGFTRDVDGEIRYECSLFVRGSALSDEQLIGAIVIAVAAVQRHTPVLEELLSGRMPLAQALTQLDRQRTLQTA